MSFWKPYDTFYLVKDASVWWQKLAFEGRQITNTRCRGYLEWHILKLFALPRRERDALYASLPGVWCRYKLPRALGVSPSVELSYLTGKREHRSKRKERLFGRIAEVEFGLFLRGAFLRTVRYDLLERLCNNRTVCTCDAHRVLFHIPVEMAAQSSFLGIFWVLSDTKVVLVLVLVGDSACGGGRLGRIWIQVWFFYIYNDGAFVILLVVAPIMRRITAGVEVPEEVGAKLWQKYHAKYKDDGMSLEIPRKTWKEYLVSRAEKSRILFLAKQNAAIERVASTGEAAVVADKKVENAEVVKLLYDGDSYWVLERTIGLDEAECVWVKMRLRNLQENCCARNRKDPSTVAKAFHLAKKFEASSKRAYQLLREWLKMIAQRCLKLGWRQRGADWTWRRRGSRNWLPSRNRQSCYMKTFWRRWVRFLLKKKKCQRGPRCV